MPFPESKRIIYKKNPLKKVICQLRFPSILKIDTEPPAAFQDAIRNNFPLFVEKIEKRVQIPQIRSSLPPIQLLSNIPKAINKNYEFSSADSIWKINLTRSFLSLSTTTYYRWEEFKSKLAQPFKAFISIYEPAFFSRLGLRYIDIFNRTELGIKDTPWENLLQPYILAILSSPISSNVIGSENVCDILLSDNESIVHMSSSFAQEIQSAESTERVYIIDSDFSNTKRKQSTEVFEKLDFLNSRASRLIRWVITEALNNAMEPEEIN